MERTKLLLLDIFRRRCALAITMVLLLLALATVCALLVPGLKMWQLALPTITSLVQRHKTKKATVHWATD